MFNLGNSTGDWVDVANIVAVQVERTHRIDSRLNICGSNKL